MKLWGQLIFSFSVGFEGSLFDDEGNSYFMQSIKPGDATIQAEAAFIKKTSLLTYTDNFLFFPILLALYLSVFHQAHTTSRGNSY